MLPMPNPATAAIEPAAIAATVTMAAKIKLVIMASNPRVPYCCRMKRLVVIAVLLLACSDHRQHGVAIARTGRANARVLVTTVGVAIKETGPAETVKQFGEVYAFSPETFAVRRDEPTQITFWNLQP